MQPGWFYLPVLPAFLLPWSPLLAGLRLGSAWSDSPRRCLPAAGAGAALAGARMAAVAKRSSRALPTVAALSLAFVKPQAYPGISETADIREAVAPNASKFGDACLGGTR